ncbi:Y-family DNA polymerase [candidate division KSB1 bacterium]|nr:Y-family DNA polymerase [candidate division KSB1 bacterium]
MLFNTPTYSINKIYALVDCNNFYASCERVFNPKLWTRPVAVLSNNDGCIVARSQEVKDMGIPNGAPYFKYREVLEKNNTAVFSSNYTLYGDMSQRVMEILEGFADRLEVYSIDEAFLRLNGFERFNLDEYGLNIRETVMRGTGIPVSVGIAQTKTLAKVANKLAKKNGGTYNLLGHPDIDAVLEKFDVWGVGRQYTKFLNRYNIKNARQLKYADDNWVRKHMTVVGLRTVWELRGISCIQLEQAPPPKKEICTSRSFGKPVETISEMREAVADYTSRAAEKLRKQRSVAGNILVFITTNRFKDEPQYTNYIQVNLPSPTSSSFDLVQHALFGLEKIFKTGYRYKKCGVLLTDICPADQVQTSLFGNNKYDPKADKLMKVMDRINRRYGTKTINIAASGYRKMWNMKRDMKSPHYTTDWNELPVVRAGFPDSILMKYLS